MTEKHHPAQEADVLPWRVLVGVLVATTALSFVLGGWACSLARRLGPKMGGPKPDAVEPVQLLHSSIERELFQSEPTEAAKHRAADRRRLDRWGWVDRDRGIVHMPIEAAMRMHLQGRRPQETAAR